MPGRLCSFNDHFFKQDVLDIFPTFQDNISQFERNYNIAPTHQVPVLLNNGVYTQAQFGFIPSFSKDAKSIQINARSESVHEKVSFQDSFRHQRCIVMVNGFYEWKNVDGIKVPHYFSSSHNHYLALAGLYNTWFDNKTGKTILSVALLTTQPNEVMEEIHDRMPVVLDKESWEDWLKNNDLLKVNALLKPCLDAHIQYHEVSDEVNSVKFNNASCIEAFEATRYVQGSLF